MINLKWWCLNDNNDKWCLNKINLIILICHSFKSLSLVPWHSIIAKKKKNLQGIKNFLQKARLKVKNCLCDLRFSLDVNSQQKSYHRQQNLGWQEEIGCLQNLGRSRRLKVNTKVTKSHPLSCKKPRPNNKPQAERQVVESWAQVIN